MARLCGLLSVICIFTFNKFVGLLHSIVSFFLLLYHPFKKLCVLTHTHIIHCRITPNLVDNSYAIAKYDFDNSIYQAEDEGEEDYEVPGELVILLQQEEQVIQPHEEPIKVVNLGTNEDRKEIKIGAGLKNSVKKRLVQILVIPQNFPSIFSR